MILVIEDVSKNYGGIKALENCTLSVKKGKITGLIGPNGSGKSTLFDAISGLIKIDKGKIFLEGVRIDKTPDFKRARKGISRTFQQVRLFSNLSIKDNIAISLLEKNERMFFNIFRNPKVNEDKIKEIMDFVGLDKDINTPSSYLSYGQKKLLDLAMAYSKPHKILLLDEPVAGINPLIRQKIKNILIRLRNKGETIFVIEHDMNFLMDLADYIYVLDAGRIISQGEPSSIQNDKKVLEAYIGE